MELKRRCKVCRKKFMEGSGYSAYPEGEKYDEKHKDAYCSSNCARRVESQKLQEVVGDLVKRICDMTNGGNEKEIAKAMVYAMIRQHRFLQGCAINTFAMFFNDYAKECEDRNLFDRRNEAAVKQAARMGKAAYDFS